MSGLLSVKVVRTSLSCSRDAGANGCPAAASRGRVVHKPVQRPCYGAVSASFLFQKINVMYLKKVLHLGANEQ